MEARKGVWIQQGFGRLIRRPLQLWKDIFLLMFAFFLRVMWLTSDKTIQGIAVRRFPSSPSHAWLSWLLFFSESACPLSTESFVPCIMPRFFILLVGWARLVPSCEFKIEAGNVFHFAKLLKMKGIARSQKRLQI